MRLLRLLISAPLLSTFSCTDDPESSASTEASDTGGPADSTAGPDTSAADGTTAGSGSGGGTMTGATVGSGPDGMSETSGDATESSTGSMEAGDSDTGSTTGGPSVQDVDLTLYEAASPIEAIPAPATNASGMTWNYDTDRFWVVQNGASVFFEYAADDLSSPIRTIDIVGINAHDTEGLAYMGGQELAIAFEGGYGVYIADVPDGDVDISVGVKQTLTLASPPGVGNNGLEGVAYDPESEVFYAVGEGQADAAPRRFFRFERPADTSTDLTWQDPGLTVTEPFDADDVLPGSGGSLDLAGIVFDARDGNVLIVSHTGSVVIQLDPTGDGTILSELELPQNQWEGVTLHGPNADLWVVGESNDVQRYVYDGS